MIKSYYQLVRDKVPSIIKSKNMTPVYRTLNEIDFKHYLKLKLKEEVEELTKQKKPDDIAKNLIDIIEVIEYMKKEHKITNKMLEKLSKQKNQ